MGLIKNKPWDDVIQFDDWKKDEVAEDGEIVEEIIENSAPAEIQGMGINRNVEENEDDLLDLIANLNAGNSKYAESVAEKEKREAEKAHAIQKQKEAEEFANAARLRFELEQAERDRILFEQEQERAEKNAELQAKKEKSIARRLTSFISQGNKKNNSVKELSEGASLEAVEDKGAVDLPETEEENCDSLSVADAQEVSFEQDTEGQNPQAGGGNEEIQNEEEKDSLLSNSIGKVESVGKRKRGSKKKKPLVDKDILEPVCGTEESVLSENDQESEILSVVDKDKDVRSEGMVYPTDFEIEDCIGPEAVRPDENTDEVQTVCNCGSADKEKAPLVTGENLEDVKTTGDQKEHAESKPEEESSMQEPVQQEISDKEDRKGEIQKPSEQSSPHENKKKSSFFGGLFKKGIKESEKQTNVSAEAEQETSVSAPDWEYIATHDELTGLLNQNAYEQAKKEKRDKPYAVVFMDVNNLKYANDTFGHEAGNKLIVAVSDQLKVLFPDCGYRTGGDEFVAIVPFKKVSKIESEILEKKKAFLDALQAKTKEDKDSGLVYSASFGYSYSDGKRPFAEVAADADKAMYTDKEAYKKAHPQFDMRKSTPGNKKISDKSTLSPTPEEGYDEFLTDQQKALKKLIQDKHIHVSNQSTMEIVREVQRRSTEVVAILVASPSFDHLFIILSADSFCDIVSEYSASIDFSYLYIIYKDGAQYKGSDEYLAGVTDLFESLGKNLANGKIQSEKDILKVKGINIFKQIFIA